MNLEQYKNFADDAIYFENNPIEFDSMLKESIEQIGVPAIKALNYRKPKRIHGDIERRIVNQIKLNLQTECWEYTGNRDNSGTGYGQLNVDGRKIGVHRLVYELFYGAIPKGMLIRHKCHVTHCCNPDHLSVGTQADNIRDMIEAGRADFFGHKAKAKKKTLNN